MENFGLGAGLAALAFWGFIAAVVVGGIWDNIRKRDAQHETVRRLIESGQTMDQELLKRLSLLNNSGNDRYDRDLKIAGMLLLPISVGMAVFGYKFGTQVDIVGTILLGVSAMIACIAIGLLIVGKFTERWYQNNQSS